MQYRRTTPRLVLFALLALASAARAQEPGAKVSFGPASKEAVAINALVGQSKVITFDRPIGRFSVSNPEVAEAVLVSPEQVVVNGKAFGQVNFIAWEKDGDRYVVFDVFVRTNLSLIDSQIRALFPDDDIRLSQANGSVVLSGSVRQPRAAQQAEAVIQAAGFKTVNLLATPTQAVAQVQLQIRVAEVSRSRLRELGSTFAYQSQPGVGGVVGSGGGPFTTSKVDEGTIFGTVAGSALNLFVMGGNTYNFLHALKTTGALRSLAEPNLIAMDGQQASFLAGGEFPVPVVQGGGSGDRQTVTIIFKEYGVRLNFKPTIIDEEHIRLELEPEVSTIDFANGVKFDGFLIPGLRTRRAKTGVELRDGQSFALAGLLDNSESQTISKIPGAGDIPVLGNLFKSKQFQKQETELMFIVTAQLVKPVRPDDLPRMRGLDGIKKESPLGVGPRDEGDGIKGKTGFSIGGSAEAQAPPGADKAGEGKDNNGGAKTAAPQTKALPAAAPAGKEAAAKTDQ